MEFLDNLTTFQSVLFYIGVPTTVVYLLMVGMTFMGMDGTDGVEADFDGDLEVEDTESEGGTFQMFTFKNMLAFLIGLSWGSLASLDFGNTQAMSIIYGALCGIGFAAFQSALFFAMSKLEQPGVVSNNDAVGKTAQVYLTIPKEGNGQGKITVPVNGVSKTLNAITHSEFAIPTGVMVKVTSIEGDIAIVNLK